MQHTAVAATVKLFIYLFYMLELTIRKYAIKEVDMEAKNKYNKNTKAFIKWIICLTLDLQFRPFLHIHSPLSLITQAHTHYLINKANASLL